METKGAAEFVQLRDGQDAGLPEVKMREPSHAYAYSQEGET